MLKTKYLLPLILILLLTFTLVGDCDWISPTGFSDPSSKWSNEENAYDGSTTSRAYHTKDTNFLELTHSAIQCDKVRIYADSVKGVSQFADVCIDVFYSGQWHLIWSGVIVNLTWVEKAIGETGLVTAMRIRWNDLPGGGYGYLYEAEFNEVDIESKESGSDWLDGWDYRKQITIDGSTEGTQTNYQMELTVHKGSNSDSGNDVYLDGHCEDNFSDIRFTTDDGTTELYYWAEEFTSGDNAITWIEFDSIADDPGSTNFYIYYGKSDDSSASDMDNTFLFADDFNYNSDGGWVWWQTPVAVRYVGTYDKTYWGWVDKSGSIWVASYDHKSQEYETFKLKDSLDFDEHASPAILIRNDAKIVVFYTDHSGNVMYWRISTNIEDISAFDAEKNFTGGRDKVCYPQPIQLGAESNKVYLFFREQAIDPRNFAWVYRTSTDGCDTFDELDQDLFDFDFRPYAKPVQEGNDKIHFLVTEFEDGTSMYDILYCYYCDGSFYEADDTKIGDVPGDLPFAKTDLDMVYDSSDGNLDSKGYDIAIDSSGNPAIVFATLETDVDDYDVHKYRYAKWNGSAWNDYPITDEGTFIAVVVPSYSGGITLDKEDPDIVYLSKQISTKWEIQKWTTADGGENWGEPVNITSSSTLKNIKPQTVLNAHVDLPVFWVWGNYSDYDDWDTSIVFKAPENKWILRQGMIDFRQGSLYLLGTPTGTRVLLDGKTDIAQGAAIVSRVKSDANNMLSSNHFCTLRKTNDWYQKVDGFGYTIDNLLRFQTRKDNVTTDTEEIVSDGDLSSFYNYKVYWQTDESKFYQGDTLKATHDTNIPTQDLVAAFYESSNIDCNAWVDWIFIRKFVDPEPTWGAWGSEESAAVKTNVMFTFSNF